MSRLKLERGTLTLPAKLRRALNVEADGYLEAERVEGGVLLKPVPERDPVVEAAIAEGLQDVRAGRMYGPFETIEEMKEYFKKHPLDRSGS
jgi:bifunctional DNA-binding transcriptional regulator/antitoxin component of YhaV-PrlF toxin-antitoxin module